MRIFALTVILSLPACGLIFRDGVSPAANTETAPTGSLAGSGWQHQINYLNFHGTVISPKHFVTAVHLGGGQTTITRPSYFRGGPEVTFAIKGSRTVISGTDLAVFEIWETFPDYAELYEGSSEGGRAMVIHGSGVGRGDEVVGKGWKWGTGATRKGRWGENTVDGSVLSGTSDLLYFDFDDVLGQNEVMATSGDSGGGWFIEDSGQWKLAAVSFAVDAFYSDDPAPSNANGFRGGFYNATGLSFGSNASGWEVIPASGQNGLGQIGFYRQSHTYGSRISSSASEIRAIIDPAIAWAALSPAEKMDAWLADYGVTAMTGQSEDADGDGLPNLVEYLTESDPSDGEEAVDPLQIELLGPGNYQFTFVESLDLAGRGLTTVLEKSTDLVTWTEVTGQLENSITRDNPGGVQTRVTTITGGETGDCFYRLQISL